MNHFDRAMQDVLSRPRYNALTGRAIDVQKIISEMLYKFFDFLIDLFDFDLSNISDYNVELFKRIFTAAAIIIAAGIVAAILIIIKKRLKNKTAAIDEPFEHNNLFADFDEKNFDAYTADAIILSSKNFAEQKKWRDAIRYYFIAVLVDLYKRHIIQIKKSKTNGQLKIELNRAFPKIAEPFGILTELVHYVWFGNKEAGPAQYEYFIKNAEIVMGRES
ncbi:MAG: DUF4129 domain-containing protein [Defluviitaleaceae bacterium]|nr:DUF4129 domain-containing protein [Defluviitaleaceae bacterium]